MYIYCIRIHLIKNSIDYIPGPIGLRLYLHEFPQHQVVYPAYTPPNQSKRNSTLHVIKIYTLEVRLVCLFTSILKWALQLSYFVRFKILTYFAGKKS